MNRARDGAVEVLILGAGIAGLTAGRALAERGLRVLVLEGRDRVGGRIYTERTSSGVLVEHGAEFIHGRAPELWALIDEMGAETVEREGAVLREAEPGGGLADDREEEEGMFSSLDSLAAIRGDDLAFSSWLAGSDVPQSQREALTGYVEGFNAADARRISIQALGVQQQAEGEIQGDRVWHLPGGYGQLPEFLAGRLQALGGEIQLGCPVDAIRWREREVVVSKGREDWRAPRCIVTLPLGVLHAANCSAPGSVRIEPEPRPLFEARRLAMGQVVRFTMIFRERWWETVARQGLEQALRRMSFLFTMERMPPVWWTRRPEPEPTATLAGWSGGPRSEALRGKSAEELGAIACRELAEAFGIAQDRVRNALVSTHTFDWSADRFACGSYSYVPVGALDASRAMTRPEAGTLFFAGEHTDVTGHWGTVHAAIRSGLRAARQVLGEE